MKCAIDFQNEICLGEDGDGRSANDNQ